MKKSIEHIRPTSAIQLGSYLMLLAGVLSFGVGLFNAEMIRIEKHYFLFVLFSGLFAAISLQRVVRDRTEGIVVNNTYYGLCYGAVLAALLALVIGLWDAKMALAEKGLYGISFALALFAVIIIQKNIRDVKVVDSLSNPNGMAIEHE